MMLIMNPSPGGPLELTELAGFVPSPWALTTYFNLPHAEAIDTRGLTSIPESSPPALLCARDPMKPEGRLRFFCALSLGARRGETKVGERREEK